MAMSIRKEMICLRAGIMQEKRRAVGHKPCRHCGSSVCFMQGKVGPGLFFCRTAGNVFSTHRPGYTFLYASLFFQDADHTRYILAIAECDEVGAVGQLLDPDLCLLPVVKVHILPEHQP